MTQTIQPFRNSISSVQKALNLTTPAEMEERKTNIIDLNLKIKGLQIWAIGWFQINLQNQQPIFL